MDFGEKQETGVLIEWQLLSERYVERHCITTLGGLMHFFQTIAPRYFTPSVSMLVNLMLNKLTGIS